MAAEIPGQIQTFNQRIEWRAGGAQGNTPEMECGDQYLLAVRVCDSIDKTKEWWEFAVITIEEFSLTVEGDQWGWSWEDVEWYAPTKSFGLPVPVRSDESSR